jgi:hypothetical protein
MSADVPCRCGCAEPQQAAVHAIARLLAADDLDAAIEAGLLACDGCPGCTEACTRSLLAARDGRRFALASRDRFRAREARLARRRQQRLEKRMQARGAPSGPGQPDGAATPSPLPTAAAAALARAKERAARGRSA